MKKPARSQQGIIPFAPAKPAPRPPIAAPIEQVSDVLSDENEPSEVGEFPLATQPVTEAERSDLSILGQAMSYPQYGWLFQDLSELRAEGLARHWADFGEKEVRAFARPIDSLRLVDIAVQRRSVQPNAAPSAFARLQVAKSDLSRLNVVFSHTFVPAGKFGFSHVAGGCPSAVLYLNTDGNDWYQRGVPGVSDSLAGIADFVVNVAQLIGASSIRTVGSSMGAYASLVVGEMAGADQAFAVDPELVVGKQYYRSRDWSVPGVFPEDTREAWRSAQRLGSKSQIVTAFGDPLEAEWALLAQEKGLDLTPSRAFHGQADVIDWTSVLASPCDVRLREHFSSAYLAESMPDSEDLRKLQAVHLASRRGEYGVAKTLVRDVRERIPAVSAYEAVLHALEGDETAADSALDAYADWENAHGIRPWVDPIEGMNNRFATPDPDASNIRAMLSGKLSNRRRDMEAAI